MGGMYVVTVSLCMDCKERRRRAGTLFGFGQRFGG